MDIDRPPSPDDRGRTAPVRADAVAGGHVIASGVGWALVDMGEAMELRVAGASPLAAHGGGWRVTPRGRRLMAVTAQGPLILDVTHGLCRPDGMPEATGGFARITLPDGRQVHGCMFAAGPYAGRAYPPR